MATLRQVMFQHRKPRSWKFIIVICLLLGAVDYAKAEMQSVHYGECRTTVKGELHPEGKFQTPCAIFIDTEIPDKFYVALLDKDTIVRIIEVDIKTDAKRVVYTQPSI